MYYSIRFVLSLSISLSLYIYMYIYIYLCMYIYIYMLEDQAPRAPIAKHQRTVRTLLILILTLYLSAIVTMIITMDNKCGLLVGGFGTPRGVLESPGGLQGGAVVARWLRRFIPVSVKKHSSRVEDRWESPFSEHQIRGSIEVRAAGSQSEGSHKGSVYFMDAGKSFYYYDYYYCYYYYYYYYCY